MSECKELGCKMVVKQQSYQQLC